jgi:hypothetical protein
MTKFRTWTSEDTDIARQMFVNAEPSEAFLAKLGRPESAARERIKRVDLRAKLERRVAATGLSRASAKAIEDAARRAVAPRSLTAIAFGDPAPGFSMLDRRNRAEASL